MPKMHVERTIRIDAPVEKVYRTVNDFNHWTAWSPWLIMEPEASVTIADDARYYEWEGERVGSGNMRITNEKPYAVVDYDLTFLKPWKSTAKVRFEMHGHGDHSHVTWYMDSSLPFFMFWMKKSMEAFVGMDYERGLNLLKDYVEYDKVGSKLEFKGFNEYSGCTYVGIRTACTRESLSSNMKNDFERLWSLVKNNEGVLAGNAFSIYHKWDMVGNNIDYTAAIPVKDLDAKLPAGTFLGNIPPAKVHTIRHIGSYTHLGNAWTAQYSMKRSKSFKSARKIDPFEVYVNMPGDVPDDQLITDINFPVV
ncbi:SRPBCC family protein [Fulvivirga sedimenti]|uniref:SRPBCC family protein n=1 Tax=Fulvivirga sedimenti TaxID=2879465 RepID=A0A9X1L049_9BACT|nr:SRPBCC family protein [Fulvivirga sedimenti]MCA6079100.1 SRPBCC family protein [Fulvivirga sedimenti]